MYVVNFILVQKKKKKKRLVFCIRQWNAGSVEQKHATTQKMKITLNENNARFAGDTLAGGCA